MALPAPTSSLPLTLCPLDRAKGLGMERGEKDNSEVHQDKAEGRNGQVEHQGKRLSSVFILYKYSDGLLLP